MSDDIASLVLRIDSVEAGLAARRLDELHSKGKKAESAASDLKAEFKDLAVKALGVVSVLEGIKKAVDVQRQFDTLNAGLVTATGSAENAARAFEAIQDFATSTPYDLGQVTEAFTKLVDYGLTPSERALTAYGDFASAKGKGLGQVIEAVADATTGQYERLKELGFQYQSQGDKVALTFRGTTTLVEKSGKAMEDYLIAISENNFAGNMANRMATLDGAISNLGDEWDKMFLNINKAGLGDTIQDGVRLATASIAEFNNMLASGQMDAILKGLGAQFHGYAQDVAETQRILTDYIAATLDEWGMDGGTTVSTIVRAFEELPTNVRTFIQLAVVEFANYVEIVSAYGDEIKDKLNPFDGDTFDLTKRLDELNQVRDQSIETILQEREAALASYDAQIQKAQELRAEYDAQQEAKKNNVGDRLEKYGIGGSAGDKGPSSEEQKAAEKETKRKGAARDTAFGDYDSLKDELAAENELLVQHYEDKQLIIEEAFQEGFIADTERKAMLEELELQHQARLGNIEAKGIIKRREFEQKSAMDKTKFLLSTFTQLTAGAAQNNRAMFEANKAFAIADATLSTYNAAAQALADYPTPYNFAVAALVVAAGLAQVQSINSTSFDGGGGGTTPSMAGTMPVKNDIPVPSASQGPDGGVRDDAKVVTINLPDSNLLSKESVRELIVSINEELNDGMELKVNG